MVFVVFFGLFFKYHWYGGAIPYTLLLLCFLFFLKYLSIYLFIFKEPNTHTAKYTAEQVVFFKLTPLSPLFSKKSNIPNLSSKLSLLYYYVCITT